MTLSTYCFLYRGYNVACEILTGFTYCGLGQRLRKIGTTDTTSYVYDGMYAVSEFDGSDNLKASYIYANGLLLGKREVTPGGIATAYYHHDSLGSTMLLTDEAGNVAQAYLYDEFGNLLQSWGGVDNHYLCTGQEWDSDMAGTELYNLRARYYDTGIGRFASEDPELQAGYAGAHEAAGCETCGITTGNVSMPFSDDPQDLNAYPYVTNNPVDLTDPLGTYGLPCIPRVLLRNVIRLYYQPGFKGRAPFIHCLATCELIIVCGLNPETGLGLGGAKEALDEFWYRLGRKTTGWEWMDIVADAFGLACAQKVKEDCTTCFECCSQKYPPK